MALITTREHNGKTVLYVQCLEPVTKFSGKDPMPIDRMLLIASVESCLGASMQLVHREVLPRPGDTGDERFDFMLELSQPNVLALSATGFAWSDDARSLTSAFPVNDMYIKEIHKMRSARMQKEQELVGLMHDSDMTQERIDELNRLHRIKSVQFQIGAVISYTQDE